MGTHPLSGCAGLLGNGRERVGSREGGKRREGGRGRGREARREGEREVAEGGKE